MSTQSVRVDVMQNQLVIEIPPEEILNLEAQVSVVPPDQIALLETIRQDSIDARNESEAYSVDARHSANKAADSEVLSGQYRDESKELNDDTRTLFSNTETLHKKVVTRHADISERHSEIETIHSNIELMEQSVLEDADRADDARDRAIVAEKNAAESEAEALESQQASKLSENNAKDSETAAYKQAGESAASALDSAGSAYSSEVFSQASKESANSSAESAEQSKQSQLAAKSSETHSKDSETSADESSQAAAGSERAALASEEQSDKHRKDSEASNQSAIQARDTAIESREAAAESQASAKLSEALARRWATEDEDNPVSDGEFSALHWAKVAEHIAGTLTNGMVFVGSWDLADGFPPEPTGTTVPWYRLTGTDTSEVNPTHSGLDKIASQSNKGDQLIWDPIKREWFVIDTSDEVWLVNGKKGNVVLNASDVGAVGRTGNQSIDGAISANDFRTRTEGGDNYPDHYGRYYLSGAYSYFVDRNSEGTFQQTGIRVRQGNPVPQVYHAVDGEDTKVWNIYHEGNKPKLPDIDAAPAGYGLGQPSLNTVNSVDELTETETGWFRAFTDTPGNPTSGSGYAIQHMAYNHSSDNFIQMAYRQSSLADIYIRSHDTAGWTDWFQLYSTRFKPTAADVGLSNVTNNRQVVLNGNNRIQSASSFIIDGNAKAGDDDNVRGVLRITLSESEDFGSKGTVFFQAGHAQSVSSSNNGAMVFGGYWGGFLQEANFKLLDAKKLTVQLSGSSTRHPVYHEGNKPTAKDVGALPIAGGGTLAGNLIVPSPYRISARTINSPSESNLHLDASGGKHIYLNWYGGGNVHFGNGSEKEVARMTKDGEFRLSGLLTANAGIFPYYDMPESPEGSARDYPGGLSIGRITNVTNNGWPTSHATVVTFKCHATDTTRMIQILGDINSRRLYWRSAHDNANDPGFWKGFQKVYHAGDKPTASDVGALPTSGGTLTGNVRLPANNVGITDSNGNRLLACPDGNNCQVGQQSTHDYVTLHAVNKNGFRVYYDGSAKLLYHDGRKPTPTEIGAEPTLTTDRKRKITISTRNPYGGSDGDIWFKVE